MPPQLDVQLAEPLIDLRQHCHALSVLEVVTFGFLSLWSARVLDVLVVLD